MLENDHSLGLDPRQSKGQQMDRRGDLLFMHALQLHGAGGAS